MNYTITRTKRKTLALQVFRDQRVEVRAPLRANELDIARFVANNTRWITKKLLESQQYPGLPNSEYEHNGMLYLLGNRLDILVNEGVRKKITLTDDQLLVSRIAINVKDEDKDKIARQIQRWKNAHAHDYFLQRLNYWAGEFPIALPEFQFKIRKMKRQWGNCNNKKLITINSQLIRYPKSCIDYVLVHELTHLRHLNHGKGFYSLMESVCADWQQQRLLLSQFSGS